MDNVIGTPSLQILDSPTVTCECGCKYFRESSILKKVSGILSGTGKPELFPIPIFICENCGKIASYFEEKPNFKKVIGDNIKND